jgi:hypothetical protein
VEGKKKSKGIASKVKLQNKTRISRYKTKGRNYCLRHLCWNIKKSLPFNSKCWNIIKYNPFSNLIVLINSYIKAKRSYITIWIGNLSLIQIEMWPLHEPKSWERLFKIHILTQVFNFYSDKRWLSCTAKGFYMKSNS